MGQNTTNVAPAIPPGIPLANANSGEAKPPREGGDATASEARIDTSQRLRHARPKCQNVARAAHEDCKPTPEPRQTERTRDSVFNRLERPVANPNLADDYDSEFERSVGSRGSVDLCARLNA